MGFVISDGNSLHEAKQVYLGTDTGLVPVKEVWYATSDGLKKVWPTTEDFITVWDTSELSVMGLNNDQIGLPMVSNGTYDFDVYYNDTFIKHVNDYTDNVITFPDGVGIKEVVIKGQFEEMSFGVTGERLRLLEVKSFGGEFKITTAIQMFFACSRLTGISFLDTSNVTEMTEMFRNCFNLVSIPDIFDTSNVTEMTRMFFACSSFNQDLSGWCVPLIPTKPSNFDFNTPAWVLPKPVWGTCP